ncbi:UdgX family uracil-DNA binding protein [Aggregicoccus sp. 17bor-14]|uniref:UdgX family uracil-DNA binding protein n=1 Tax=Myxococcaceae TaxID=31 RepID=UPI0012EFDC4F|nr:UdgX family uracil-DNA binding protein [Simulacricoccus sp. 17bor-14]MRI86778.1 UdgX family uracil-DNA binding protein [Aggregicoccus sp. 17bor-14]
MRRVCAGPGFADFRREARALLAEDVPPDAVVLEDAAVGQAPLAGLFAAPHAPEQPARPTLAVPSAFLRLGEQVACHRDGERWGHLYRVLWRLTHGERHLLEVESDPDVRRLQLMAKAVERDVHKLHAFVRFRRVEQGGQEHYVAWHRPDHLIVERAAPFFARRFPSMRWSLLTPDACAYWDLSELRFGEGVPRSAAPEGDALEALWRTYYAAVFNPARLNPRAMRAQLPVRHWATLPEAPLIRGLVRSAPTRVERMVRPPSAPSASAALLPPARDLGSLAAAARGCTACPLHARATQTVFGEGPGEPRLMLVGEQPGDTEDRVGRPFQGPAGQLLDEVLAQVGIAREQLYVTNAVKHFGWTGEPTRRLHQKPGRAEVLACRGWLEAEVAAVRPRMILALGATAAQSFLGPGFKLTHSRGQVFETPWAPWWLATYHPSALLRMPDPRTRAQAHAHFVEDLQRTAEALRRVA